MRTTRYLLIASVLFSACGGEEAGDVEISSELSASARRARAEVIRDVVLRRGITNGALFAGIGDAETGLAHCWSEATWACQGPWSSTCGGPVIAGSGDGPCWRREGGLGMFQFDGGTHDQTLARDGEGILTLEGNVDHAVDFVIGMVIRSSWTPEMYTAEEAIAWMNSVPIAPGDGAYEAWISTVTRYYNGCPPNASCWRSRRAGYESKTRGVFHEMGAEGFWGTKPEPPPPPPPPPEGCGVLRPDQVLGPDQSVTSCNGAYVFVHQSDGNVVLYETATARPLWHTKTHGRKTDALVMQGDGNLVLYAPGADPIWASGTDGQPGAWLAVQDDANVVIYGGPGAIWATNTAR